ncbi:MAG: MotA/TolQ/ExbB proton channel family protein [Fusobacterium necrophorum]|nr:MotA/TolQ/ExbB proton channel family protein [Fusobacterium necrophorum]MCI7680850.1 MotA/TolQ/ExbB proton channel family protein [Fusobacterium necrophorum]MDY2574124.1 MotA/TolQ/ExbB proton channel family protein [Fusobacterium necrophorum]MDY6173298.1 MotA/TolQ/ExbB proton channel family protein [Fusobacterium necrophorum]
MQFMKIGGLLMWFIFALGVLGLYAILERTVYFMIREKNSIANLNKKLKDMLEKNKIKEAIVHLNSNKSSSARVLQAILIYGYKENKKSLEALEEKGKEVAIQQLRHLERNMWLISVAAHVAPLVGLLGTVTGMIKAFQAVALYGTGDPAVLAKGISEALYTTAGGLFVAIPAMILYNYYNKKIDSIISDMEQSSTELLNYFRR